MVVVHEKCAWLCCICICLFDVGKQKKNIYEKHLYDKIPLECEARQCYDADYDDSLSPFNTKGQRNHLENKPRVSLLSSHEYLPVQYTLRQRLQLRSGSAIHCPAVEIMPSRGRK